VHLVLHEFVCVVNVMLKIQIKWHARNDLVEVMTIFKNLLLSVHSTINVTQIHLQKPKGENFLVVIFYSFKSKGYNI
jgi:hypothetical protein